LPRHRPEVVLDLPGEEKAEAAEDHEWQTPLERNGRRSKSARESGSVLLPAFAGRMLLSPCAHHLHVRKRGGVLLEERALLPCGLEEDEMEVGPGNCKRQAGRAAARADVDDRTALEQRSRDEDVFDMDAAGLFRIVSRCQARSGDQRIQPAPEARVVSYLSPRSGRTTTRRFGSLPSLEVSTPPSS
jgi:hypothetical protein